MQKQQLKVLVCSGNLGNACPDEESLAAWIPADGLVREVVVLQHDGERQQRQQQKYPLCMSFADAADDDDDVAAGQQQQQQHQRKMMQNKNELAVSDDGGDEEEEEEQFDIIAIGMQEATFDPPKKEKTKKIDDPDETKDGDTDENNAAAGNNDDDDDVDNNNSSSNHGSMDSKMSSTTSRIIQMQIPVISKHYVQKGVQKTSKQVQKGIQKTSRHVQKTLSKISLLTASDVDHTKKAAPLRKNSNTKKNNVHSTTNTSTGITDSTKESLRQTTTTTTQLRIPANEWQGGTVVLHSLLQGRLPSYEKVVSYQRGEMRLEVFCLQKSALLLSSSGLQFKVLHVAAQNTGMGGLAANKGGIVAQLLVTTTTQQQQSSETAGTRLAFMTAHLEAHEGPAKYARRCESLSDIWSGTSPPTAALQDVSLLSHYTFVCGDLNFRTELPDYSTSNAAAAAAAAEKKNGGGGEKDTDKNNEAQHKQQIRALVQDKNWKALNQADELQRALRVKDCLVGFQTPLCVFPPTFKLQRKAGYDYVDQRRPSYTDRVLWKTGHQLDTGIQPLVYEPIDVFSSSDHKPVRAAFSVQLNEPCKMRPLMTRRPSVMNFRHSFVKKRGWHDQPLPDEVVADNERLYLFVSDMSCILSNNIIKKKILAAAAGDATPNPYIRLISQPHEAIQRHQTKWQKWKRKFRFRRKKKRGFLRSSVQKSTFSPDWGDEEIHADVKTHNPDGSPVDLTGATLHLTVMDHRLYSSGIEDTVLGTFSLNLANLILSARRVGGGGESRRSSSNRFLRNRSSSTGFQQGHASNDAHNSIDSAELMKGGGIPIDAPLLLNGNETGRIRFRVEAWWMNEFAAKAAGAFASNGSDNSQEMLTIRTDGQVYVRTTSDRARSLTRQRGGQRPVTIWKKFSSSFSE